MAEYIEPTDTMKQRGRPVTFEEAMEAAVWLADFLRKPCDATKITDPEVVLGDYLLQTRAEQPIHVIPTGEALIAWTVAAKAHDLVTVSGKELLELIGSKSFLWSKRLELEQQLSSSQQESERRERDRKMCEDDAKLLQEQLDQLLSDTTRHSNKQCPNIGKALYTTGNMCPLCYHHPVPQVTAESAKVDGRYFISRQTAQAIAERPVLTDEDNDVRMMAFEYLEDRATGDEDIQTPFLMSDFLQLMNDIGEHGFEKYGPESFQAHAAAGDYSRWMPRVEAQQIMEHVKAHADMYLRGELHDYYHSRKHQLSAIAYNAQMEYHFLCGEQLPLFDPSK